MSRARGARGLQPSVVLRLVAFAIALAGLIDPAISLSGATRARLAIVAQQPVTTAAGRVANRLRSDLGATYEIAPWITSDAAAAIVIGDRYPVEPVADALLVATVTAAEPAVPGPRIVHVESPREVPSATMIHLDVDLDAPSDAGGPTTDVTASIAGLEAGRATHRWAVGESRWRAGIDAVPVGDAPYTVRLNADTTGTADVPPSVVSRFSRTVADIVVDIRRSPFRVEFYDPRPSWATTFLRRALEADPRFQVATLSATSRGVTAQTGGAVPLGDPRLDTFDVIIVGGLDRLTAAEAQSLDRFMRERGGAVIVVPDQRIDSGPARDLVSGGISGRVRLQPDLAERLLEQPAKLMTASVSSIQASELLVARSLPPGSDVVARIPGAGGVPVIVSMPRGDGRLLLSGAMDAWRFRAAADAAFDRFWQSAVAGLALAVPPPIAIDVDPALPGPGEPAEVTVRVRARDAGGVSASLDGEPVRLVPDAETGVYRGRFNTKSAPGRSTIEVRAAAGPKGSGVQTPSRILLVRPDIRRVPPASGPSLAMLASSHRGIDVTPDRVADLERFVRDRITAAPRQQVRHPMRSTWWIVPFAGCLSMEWWLRRRRGLR